MTPHNLSNPCKAPAVQVKIFELVKILKFSVDTLFETYPVIKPN